MPPSASDLAWMGGKGFGIAGNVQRHSWRGVWTPSRWPCLVTPLTPVLGHLLSQDRKLLIELRKSLQRCVIEPVLVMSNSGSILKTEESWRTYLRICWLWERRSSIYPLLPIPSCSGLVSRGVNPSHLLVGACVRADRWVCTGAPCKVTESKTCLCSIWGQLAASTVTGRAGESRGQEVGKKISDPFHRDVVIPQSWKEKHLLEDGFPNQSCKCMNPVSWLSQQTPLTRDKRANGEEFQYESLLNPPWDKEQVNIYEMKTNSDLKRLGGYKTRGQLWKIRPN